MTEPTITTWEMTTAARDVRCLPDGTKISPALKHTLVTLATYWPNIWPSQDRLASDMSINRASVNKRLRKLEDAGLVKRIRRGRSSTLYLLSIRTMRECIARDTGINNKAPEVQGPGVGKQEDSLDGYNL